MEVSLNPSEMYVAIQEYLAKRGLRLASAPIVTRWSDDSKLAAVRCEVSVESDTHPIAFEPEAKH